jgi:ribosomal-protein-alanine N-acetyltransferase
VSDARVYLRPPAPEDEQPFLAAMRASVELHRPWLWAPQTELEYLGFLERAARPASAFHLVVRRGDDALLGFINISEIVRGNLLSAYVGYGAVAEHTGQGYLGEAMLLVLERAFGPLGLHRIEANIQPDNAASIALARRCGFEREGLSPRYLKIGGEWRDHERWAILSERFAARAG